jgi:hypothetical protein
MVRNNNFLRATILFCTSALILLGAPVFANNSPASDNPAPESAMATIQEYRELRRDCTGKTGAQQKLCFHELHASNRQYRVAKQQLQLGETENLHNIHLVTF